MKKKIFDVCVIGTGAGGGVMIQELTAAGLEVVALQRGPELQASQFQDDELEVILRDQLFAPGHLESYRARDGEAAVAGRYNQMAHMVGGTMTRWSGWSWRFLPDDFRVLSKEGPIEGASLADWPVTYAEMEPYYTRAERDFGVSGKSGSNPFAGPRKHEYPNPPHTPRPSSEVFEAGAKKLGLHPFPLPVAINPRPYGGRGGCVRGGTCQGFGCPVHAKATTFSVCLPRARATGKLDLRSDAEVIEIPVDAEGRATGARYLDAAGMEHEVRARRVVLCGNAVGSARLLLLSKSGSFPAGLANSSGLVGRNFMLHHHAAVRMRTSEPSLGVTGIEAYRAVDDFHPSEPKRGFVRGGVIAEVNAFTRQPLVFAFSEGGHPKLGRAWGSAYKDYLREFRHTVAIGSILEDLPMESNRVDLDPEIRDARGLPVARITHRQHPNDIAMNHFFGEKLMEVALACGPEEASPYRIAGTTWVDEDNAVKGGAHLHGTCRMGVDPSRSVLDAECRAHDVPNLWVVDGSCFPTAGGYNPTLTILANAYRVAERMREKIARLEA